MPASRLRSGLAVMLRSVFLKCAGFAAVTAIVVAAVMAYQSERLNTKLARQGVIDLAAKTAELKAASLVQPLRFGAVPKIEEEVQDALRAAGPAARAVIVLNREGAPVAQSGADADVQGVQQLAARALDSGDTMTARQGLSVALPVTLPDGAVLGVVALALDDSAAQAAIAGDKMVIRVTAIVVLVVLLGVTGFGLQRVLGRPIAQINARVGAIAAGDYEHENPLRNRGDELGAMARHLEDMARALQQSREAEALRAEQHAAQADVVRHLSTGLDALADGLLTQTLNRAFPEDYETLRRNFNRAVGSLRDAVSAVKDSALSIRNGADEIGRASDDLSRRTETQAATLEQSAAALDELLQSVKSAAKGAGEVDQSVQNASDLAHQNGTVMQQAVSAMTDIEKSAEQIGQIISVIDDIAFQTNLLALNAGVEAARAGESGRGFAVVATEVRALAQRSSQAAQEIKGLVGNSTEQIKNGAVLVQQAGEALQEVVGKVTEISGHVSGIARGASEQADGLNEINVGIGNLDRVTQQNAAMVEQATAAAHTLREDATRLTDIVAGFAIDGTSEPVPGGDTFDDFMSLGEGASPEPQSSAA